MINKINGTVIEVNRTSVKCEVCFNGKNKIITLTKRLFKDSTKIGYPFTILFNEVLSASNILIKDRVVDKELS